MRVVLAAMRTYVMTFDALDAGESNRVHLLFCMGKLHRVSKNRSPAIFGITLPKQAAVSYFWQGRP